MSLETEGNSDVASESVSSSESTPVSTSEYSAVDPGYDSSPSSEIDDLSALKAENETKKTPSETSDDASEDTESVETEEETETQSTVESAENIISDELLDRATELGYTLGEIKGFTSEKSLEKEVARVEKLQQRLQARQSSKESPAKDDQTPAEEVEVEPDWAEMIELGHDPDVVGLQEKMWQRATRAEAMVKQVFQADRDRAWAAHCERFDDSINKLGEEFKSLLGNGRRGDLMKTSPEAVANRDQVFQKMEVLMNGYQSGGKPMPSEDELIQEAVQASFWKQTKTFARKELTSDIKKAGSQALSRPRSSGTKALTGQASATAKEKEFWKSHS